LSDQAARAACQAPKQPARRRHFRKSIFCDNRFEKIRIHVMVFLAADQRAPGAPRAAIAFSFHAGELTR
jgi:hypothetical protein